MLLGSIQKDKPKPLFCFIKWPRLQHPTSTAMTLLPTSASLIPRQLATTRQTRPTCGTSSSALPLARSRRIRTTSTSTRRTRSRMPTAARTSSCATPSRASLRKTTRGTPRPACRRRSRTRSTWRGTCGTSTRPWLPSFLRKASAVSSRAVARPKSKCLFGYL